MVWPILSVIDNLIKGVKIMKELSEISVKALNYSKNYEIDHDEGEVLRFRVGLALDSYLTGISNKVELKPDYRQQEIIPNGWEILNQMNIIRDLIYNEKYL